MYTATKCNRCGREFSTSVGATMCRKCTNRRNNGLRLAAVNRENRAYKVEEETLLARLAYAAIFGVQLSDVPAYVGNSARDPMPGV